MGPFKKYVTFMMRFFNSFTCVTLCQLHSITFLVLLFYSLKITNSRIRENKIFCMYGCFSVLWYIKEVRKSHI